MQSLLTGIVFSALLGFWITIFGFAFTAEFHNGGLVTFLVIGTEVAAVIGTLWVILWVVKYRW
jgi:hypothetical protein